MADNLTTQSTTPATVPSASVIATDDVTGVHFQKVKLDVGGDGVSVPATGDGTNGLDVDVTRVQGTVTVDDGGSTLSVDDGGGSLTVDGTVGVSGSVAVTGAFYQATQPVSGTVAVTGAYQATQPVSLATAPTTPVTGTFWQATQPVSGTVGVTGVATAANQLPDGHNVVVTSAPTTAVTIATMPTTPVTGAFYPATQDVNVTGNAIGLATAAKQPVLGTAGTASTDVITVQGISGGTAQPVSISSGSITLVPATSGGLTISKTVSAASTNATVVKASAGQLYGWVITNTNTAARYVKFHNSATTPTAGSGVVLSLMIPGNSAGSGQVAAEFSMGIPFSTGIAFTTVTTAPDAGSTGISADELIVNLFYK